MPMAQAVQKQAKTTEEDHQRMSQAGATGVRAVDGKVLPVDERVLEHWNHDPWTLDTNGNGRSLADGNSFLLPYYMGLYFGYVKE